VFGGYESGLKMWKRDVWMGEERKEWEVVTHTPKAYVIAQKQVAGKNKQDFLERLFRILILIQLNECETAGKRKGKGKGKGGLLLRV
jgi:hypothetical protein